MADPGMDYENPEGDRYEGMLFYHCYLSQYHQSRTNTFPSLAEEAPRYRDPRSASPRPTGDDGHEPRRSASPNGHDDRGPRDHGSKRGGGGGGGGGGGNGDDDDSSINPGSNLFVTGIHPKLSEGEVTRVFEKYGEVEKCQIMRDPHTKESRGFGFVKMVTSDQADAAKDGLQGEVIEGRTLSIEKARRARPRTPTPGKYFGPPKRGDRFNDRRGGGGGGGRYGGGYGGGRDDPYRYRGGGGGGGGFRDDRGGDRDRSYRDDRGGYGRDYDRDRSYRDDRGTGYGGRDYDRGAGYERRERGAGGGGGGGSGGAGAGGDDYSRGYGGRGGDDREARYAGGRGGDDRRAPGYERSDRGYDRGDRDGPRTREPAASGYSESASRPEGRDAYAGAP
ncbi:hypothetical protein BKA67DRAFT_534260 [Truncatella angustata]|uniref:RRM domain-containing protein n=1 Tax=Truncatella angustata TaxID=152316 RepID=A0A9P8ZZQ7_9PEZI|nr:uncharacterized protein BKA67DRAFT_534260 [Truncatella angustata]KAH6655330.1 hypothetical protein BKA67DRAFT_534260 [Truncatella angustata]